MSKKIIRKEVRSAVHIPRTRDTDDYHYVRLLVTYEDGTRENKIQMVRDYMRPVYVTAPPFRNHRERKEYEDIDKLSVRETTDSDLYRTVANLLGTPHLANRRHELRKSPYVYGIDMSAASLIKLDSLIENDFQQSPYTVAMLDLETDMERDEILIGSIAMERNGRFEIYAVVEKDWVKEIGDYSGRLYKKFKELYPKEAETAKVDIVILEDQLDMIKALFKVANRWSPDWLSVWNIDFDLNMIILNILKKRGKSPLDYICDDRVPRELRRFEYVEDPETFEDSNGRVTSVSPENRWHKIYSTTTFHFIDGMCTYKALRLHHPNERSYSLDYILRKNLENSGKVGIEGAGDLTGGAWHSWAQQHAKVEYGAYNLGDNIEPIYLDKKTKDLSVSLPVFAEACDFNDFGSSNRKIYPALYHYCLRDGVVLGIGVRMEDVYDKYANNEEIDNSEVYRNKVLDANGWIQALAQDNVLDIGITPYRDYPYVKSRSRTNVADMDSISSYPSCTIAGNVSKSTCLTEVSSLEGYDVDRTKETFLGLIVGNTNTLEIVSDVANLPTAKDVVQLCLEGGIEEYM